MQSETTNGHQWTRIRRPKALSTSLAVTLAFFIANAQPPQHWQARAAVIAFDGIEDDQEPPTDCCDDGDDQDADCDPPSANDGAGEDDSNQPPGCCCDLGMPAWHVTEPNINLWIIDHPLGYRTSNGKLMPFKLTYKHRGLDRSTNACGFGPRWECNWIGNTQSSSTNADSVLNFLSGGGFRPFRTDGSAEYKTGRTLSSGATSEGSGAGYVPAPPRVTSPRGSANHYAIATVLPTPSGGWVTNYAMTRRADRYGRAVHYNYELLGDQILFGLARLMNVVDVDGRTNTVAYENGSFPNLITSVTDPYSRSAHFRYDERGWLTNIVDMIGMSSSFFYNTNRFVTNMTTLYGPTFFEYFGPTNLVAAFPDYSVRITEATGEQQLFAYRASSPEYAGCFGASSRLSHHWNRSQYEAISEQGKTNVLDLPSEDYLKAPVKRWLLRSEPGVSSLSDTLSAMAEPYDAALGVRPGCFAYTYQGQTDSEAIGTLKRVASVSLNGTLLLEIERNTLGRPLSVTRHLSDGSTATDSNTFDTTDRELQKQIGPRGELVRGYGYHPVIHNLLTSVTNAVGEVLRYTHETNTLKVTGTVFASGLVRTNLYFTSGPSTNFLQMQIDLGLRTNSFAYDKGNLVAQTNELGLVTINTYDDLNRLTSTRFPDDTTISNVYDKLDLVATKDRLGHWTYSGYNAVRQLMAETNANGQVTTYSYCGCGSPSAITRWNGTNPVTILFLYDIAGRLTNTTYADGYQVSRAYDDHSQVKTITDSGGRHLELDYVQVGLHDKLAHAYLVSDLLGQRLLLAQQFDEYGSVTNSVDRNGVTVTNGFDLLHRLVARQSFGASGQQQTGLETFAFNERGLINSTDALGHPTTFVRDAAGRVVYQTNANNEVVEFTYNAADEILSLTDGKHQTTRWNYDEYGRATNKLDATGAEIFRYTYDPNDRLTNRWTPAKGNTAYVHDNLGNLLSIHYPQSTINYSYDGLNRLTNSVDAVGTDTFIWTDGDQLQSEVGPWPNSTVSYTYTNRLRSSLSINNPLSTINYLHDEFGRLTNVTSQAGSFGYQYAEIYNSSLGQWAASDLVQQLALPTGAGITNSFDDLARLVSTVLQGPDLSTINSHSYQLNEGSQRTQQVFTAGNYVNYTYDKIGQLKTAKGKEPSGTARLHEQFGYAYDPAWNLNYRTNNALVQTFGVNDLNELTSITRDGTLTVAGTITSPATNVAVNGITASLYGDLAFSKDGFTLADGTNTFTATAEDAYGRRDTNTSSSFLPSSISCSYDSDGNLRTNGNQILEYNPENQLVTNSVPGAWKSEFVYDGLGRRRIERDYGWQGAGWALTNETRLLYDGRLPVQHRDASNAPWLTLTRGLDLSGTLEGPGGIGGLLALSRATRSGPEHLYYHSDGGGNVICLISLSNVALAKYEYDPFGSILLAWGPRAAFNPYRYSSKPIHELSGNYDFLYRWYVSTLQRWANSDPLADGAGLVYQAEEAAPWRDVPATGEAEASGLLASVVQINVNLSRGVRNDPINRVDFLGLADDSVNACARSDPGEVGKLAREVVKEGKEAVDKCKRLEQLAKNAKKLDPKELARRFKVPKEAFHRDIKKQILKDFSKEFEKRCLGNNPDVLIDAEGNIVLRSATGFIKEVWNTGISALSYCK